MSTSDDKGSRHETALRMAKYDMGDISRETYARDRIKVIGDEGYLNFALDLAEEACKRARKVEAGDLVACRFAAALEQTGDYSIQGWRDQLWDRSHHAPKEKREADWMSNAVDACGDGPRSNSFGTVYLTPPKIGEVEGEVDDG